MWRTALLALVLVLSTVPSMASAEEVDGGPWSHDIVTDVGLDPGHSRADVGAAGAGRQEVDLTLVLALKVRDLLAARGFSVALSRLDNEPVSNLAPLDPTERIRVEQEARISAVGRVRVYISLHFNGYDDPRVRGAETYFNPDNSGEESSRLAILVHEALLAHVRGEGYPLPDRGVRPDLAAGKPYGHFFSLRGPAPSILVEAMFLSNPQEAALMGDEATLDAVARGVAEGVERYLSGAGS